MSGPFGGARLDLEVRRGARFYQRLDYTDSDGTAPDLTGYCPCGASRGASSRSAVPARRSRTRTLGLVGEENMPRWAATGLTAPTLATGVLRLAYFRARATRSVSQLRVATGSTAAGATPTLCKLGLYSVASNGDLTLLQATTNDTSMFGATLTVYTKSITATTITEGQVYAVGMLVVTAAAAPSVVGVVAGTATLNGYAPKLAASFSGQTDIPSSITAANAADTQSIVWAQAL